MINEILQKLLSREDLSSDEAAEVMDMIMEGTATAAQIAGIIIALKLKGEKASEVAGFVRSMRNHSVRLKINDPSAVDGCGTGGDGARTFNISTAAAIVASAAGATVAKHGNRSISSQCGSADLLEACKANIDPGPKIVEGNINSVGFGFMFAPRFHPAMKHAAGPRRELGVRTVFNILGPMTNPAGVKRQVIGVYDKELMPLMAEVLQQLGSDHVIVAHARDGLDEFSISSPTDYIELKQGILTPKTLSPSDAGLQEFPDGSLAGGEAIENRSILQKVLAGGAGPYRTAVVLNAGAIIYVAGKAETIRDGVRQAERAIDDKSAEAKLSEWVRASQRQP